MPRGSRQPYRHVRVPELGGGLNDFENELKLGSGGLQGFFPRVMQTPNAKNIEFDRDSLAATGGSIKFNNQIAPSSAIRTKCDKALSPLYTGVNQAVPLRGYGYLPYSEETDLGGRSDMEGSLTANPATATFHNRRGRSFELNVSFQLPPEEKLYEASVRGSGAPAIGAESAGFSAVPYDEALDECTLIIQKGGDRTAPISWALGIVNVGAGAGLSQLPATRVSNYALVFMWLDSAQWGQGSQTAMQYNLTSGALPTAGARITNALRAILIHKYVEPGRNYHVAVQLSLDTGSAGAAATNTSWNEDGSFKVWVSEETATPTSYTWSGGSASGMEVYKGPTDSFEYLAKYGIRYFGRDAMFLGLGYRNAPFKTVGFLPNGFDSAPLRNGGFQMVDASASTVQTLYGVGIYTLTTQHTGANAYVELNHQALVAGNTNGQWTHFGTTWNGYGNGTLAQANTEALKGYYLVFPNDAAAGMRGARVKINTYTEVGASFRIDVSGAGFVAWTFAQNIYTLIQCFRWHQRDLVIGEVRIWSAPRNYTDEGENGPRRMFSLRSTVELDDETEPDIANLIARWPCDDAGGATLREVVVGGARSGFLAPFGLGSTQGGLEGGQMVFVSGEGEAPTLDLSENPIFLREIANMLAGTSQGFALELSGVFTEAFYPITTTGVALPDRDSTGTAVNGTTMQMAPTVLTWDVKDAVNAGTRAQPRPIIALTFGGAVSNSNAFGATIPAMPSVEIATRADGQNIDAIVPSDLNPWFQTAGPSAFTTRYDTNAGWVGKLVTIQIGVQSTGTANEYDVYIAMSPKSAFQPATGDPSNAEFAYWTVGGGTYSPNANYYTAAHVKIDPKEIARSVIRLGRWNPGTTKGYCDLQPRMLVDKIRVYGASAPGALPTTNGGILTSRNGKLEGTDAMPQRLLVEADLLRPIGYGLRVANVVENSVTVTAPTGARIFTTEPRSTLDAVKGTYLYVPGDRKKILETATQGTEQEEFYRVGSVQTAVAVAGQTLTLETAYQGPSHNSTSATSLRILGYTAFEDDIRDKLLTLGSGTSFIPGTTTVADVVLSDDIWTNVAPVTGNWKLSVYSPLGRTSLFDILPSWTRGLVVPRRNPILGITSHNGAKYAAVRGALYELDDRWHEDGPTEELKYSLAFRGVDFIANLLRPEQADRAVLATSNFAAFVPSSTNDYMYVYDAWVWLDSIGLYQTVFWIGDPNSDATQFAANSLHKLHQILRFNQGRPELVFGATAPYTGTTPPEKGLFIAQGGIPIEPARWNHIRFVVATRTTGGGEQRLKIPYLKINGKKVSVSVNAVDSGMAAPLSDDWLRATTLVTGTGLSVTVGAAHDSYKSPDPNLAFSASALGTNFKPQRIQGWLHSLNGRLSRVVISRQPVFSGSEPADFDPMTVTYSAASVNRRMDILEPDATFGVGHLIEDEPSSRNLTIVSHPFISRWHEMGMSDLPASFAEYGQQLIATNGGRPARLQEGLGALAGVLPPTTLPGFRVDRFPLWRPNYRNANTIDDKNDPIAAAASAAADQINHYDNHGNNYLAQSQVSATGETEILWNKDASGTRYFGFKGYVRLRSVAGRIVLFAKRQHPEQGGPFVECVDGKLRIGWYDLYLKKEVYVETTNAVFAPGYWHYVNVRKAWPPQHGLDGNWLNEYWTNGNIRKLTLTGPVGTFLLGESVTDGTRTARVTRVYGAASTLLEVTMTNGGNFVGVITGGTSGATGTFSSQIRPMLDKALVRRFRRSGDSALGTLGCWPLLTKGSGRNCLSFTTKDIAQTTGIQGNGAVSAPGIVFTGAAGGIVTVSGYGGAGFNSLIHGDMLGMYFEWASGTAIGRTYKITSIGAPPTNVFTCVNVDTGTTDDFAALGYGAATAGAIFSGTGLVKSADFDNSRMPDDGQYPIMAFGDESSGDPLSGVSPFDGEFASFGWTNIVDDNGEDARVFENVNTAVGGAAAADPVEVGTDTLQEDITAIGVVAGELHYDAWTTGGAGVNLGTFYCADGQTYAGAGGGVSTQPNSDLKIAKDTSPATSASAGDAIWKYLQQPTVFAGERFVRVRFFDLEQNTLSNPGSALTVSPDGEDIQNPSGQVRYVLTGLPAPRQAGRFEVWIYMGLAGGDDSSLFRVARVPAGTREVGVIAPELNIEEGQPIDFTSGEPPRSELVASDGRRVFYAALEVQPDGYAFSQVGFPTAIDYTKADRFNSGQGEKITMLRSLDGFVLMAKRRALAAVYVSAEGNPILSTIGEGVGCVAQQSAVAYGSRVMFLSEQGIEMVQRTGQTNLGFPTFVSRKIQDFLLGDFDRAEAFRCSGAINRRRREYVLTAKLDQDREFRERIALDYSQAMADTPVSEAAPGGYRFARHRGPSLTALASVQAEAGSLERLVGGTAEGFAVWLDREDTTLQGMGSYAAFWGFPEITASSTPGSTTSVTTGGSGLLDLVLEGNRGCTLRYLDAQGRIAEVPILFGFSTTLYFAEKVEMAVEAASMMTLGQTFWTWETPWMDMGNPEVNKTLAYFDLVTFREALGEVQVDLYVDLDPTTVADSKTIDLSNPQKTAPFGTVTGRYFKAVLRAPDGKTGQKPDIAQVVFRLVDSDQD